MIDVQEHLAHFDGWLTGRIEEAHRARKDLAFRNRSAVPAPAGELWEYSLLEPGALAPHGEGWSVYRLQGVWPEFAGAQPAAPSSPVTAGPRSFWARVAEMVLGRA